MRPGKASLVIPVLLTLLPALALAVQSDRIAAIDSGQKVTLAGSIHPNAQPKYDQGPVEPSFRLAYVTLQSVPSANQQKALDRLLAEQQDPSSKNYHKWLTPEQYADRFGLSQADIQKITSWLKSQGFKIERVARARNWIAFSGNAAQIQNAFQTEIHRYNVEGEMHFANATAPAIPAGLRGIVTGLGGLHDFRPRPRGIKRNAQARPYYNSSSFGDLIAPGDVATIYDLNALYAAGIDGTGQKIAIAGQTDIYLADIADFRTGFGLSPISCTTGSTGLITACNTSNFQYVLVGTDPGSPSSGDLGEADLDIEWSGAVARNAQIIFVNGETARGAFDAYYDAIDNQRAPVISLSYGVCEQQNAAAGSMAGDEAELKKGNSFGITIVNSTGDVGVAECENNGSTIATTGLAVSYPASSQYVTGVGGTALPVADLPSNPTFWGTTNGTDGGTALSYIPEQPWNDDLEFFQFCTANPTDSFCTSNHITSEATAQAAIGIGSSGGGASNCATTNGSGVCTSPFPQPSWQTVTISGQASARFSPDVSLMASPNFPGYIFCTQLSELGDSGTGSSCAPGGTAGITNALGLNNPSIIGGTSVSAPVFAGIVALLDQSMASSGLGNVNPMLYRLAATAPSAFHDITSGNNTVSCTPNTPSGQPAAIQCPSSGSFGYSARTGYDLVTGLGSVDTNNLAVAFKNPPDFTVSALNSPVTLPAGGKVQDTITVTPVNGFNQSVSFACAGLAQGENCSFAPASVTPSGSPATSTLTISTAANMATGSSTISVTSTAGVLSQRTNASSVSLNVTATTESFTLAANPATLIVHAGQTTSNTENLTVTDPGNTGFIAQGQTTLPLTYTCTVSPSASEGPTCTFSPSSGQNVSVTNPTVAIVTIAPTANLSPPLGRRRGIFYAMLLPGLLGIALAAGSRTRALRLLGLIVVLGFSTLWLGACGGSSNNSQKNPGTPAGNYTVTVNATTGGASPLTAQAKFTVTVQ
jgi:subtilase family serine protease